MQSIRCWNSQKSENTQTSDVNSNFFLEICWKYDISSRDNTEKIWVHQFLAKPKTITAGGMGRAVSSQRTQGDVLVKAWVQSP